MARGGARPGAGRKKKVIEEEYRGPLIEDYSKLTPVIYWQAILQDPKAPPSWRLMAADKLAPYKHAKPAPRRTDEGQGDFFPEDQSSDDATFSSLPPVRH